jgi:hypothetical protein
MKLKKAFEKYKNYSTDGYPDIFWPWTIESIIIVTLSLVLARIIVIYLKSKGLL